MDKKVKKDFLFLKKEVLGVLIYGSHAKGEAYPRSDIDICIVIGKPSTTKEMLKVLQKVWRNVNTNKKNYDVKFFEELPLRIKMEVIKEGKVVIGDNPTIYEYFYKFRKIWEDQKHRQRL